MVAFSSHTVRETTEAEAKPRGAGGLRRLIQRGFRVVDLQYRIWLTQAKITVRRIVLFSMLFGIAAVLGLLAIIFLYIGVFRLLTDVAGLAPVWAFLIYGGFHLVLAGVLVWIGAAKLSKKDVDSEEEPRKLGTFEKSPAGEKTPAGAEL